MNGRTEEWMDGWIDGWKEGRTDGWMNEWISTKTPEHQRGVNRQQNDLRVQKY